MAELEGNLFVEEVHNGETVFVTWFSTLQYNNFLYGRQISCSDLAPKGFVIRVQVDNCVEDTGDFFIQTENPQNDDRIEIVKVEDCPVTF